LCLGCDRYYANTTY